MENCPFLKQTEIQIGSCGGVIMYMTIGLGLGIVFGTALDNLALGIDIGVAVGAWIDSSYSSKRKKDKNKWWYNFKFANLPFERGEILFPKGFFNLSAYSQTWGKYLFFI